MPRNAVSRQSAKYINVFACEVEKIKTDEPLRQVPYRQGMAMVEAGKCLLALDGNGEPKGIRLVERRKPATPSPCVLTLDTMKSVSGEGIAGVNARDTWRYTEAEQANRDKFAVWAFIGDTKAVAVRPRVSEADRKRAESLLGVSLA